ncbi:MAG: hypothetical protein ACREDZ_15515 [Kiloniellales bacterium]
MRTQDGGKRRSRQFGRSLAVAAGLTLAIGSQSAKADSAEVAVVSIWTPEIVVLSNGSSYTQLQAPAGFAGKIRAQFDAGVSGRVKSWKVWFVFKPDSPFGGPMHLSGHGYSKSYSTPRPKSVDRTEHVEVPGSAYEFFALAHCNGLADQLRQSGLSNHQIFDQDRKIVIEVGSDYEVEFNGVTGGPPLDEAEFNNPTIQLVCQKWHGSTAPVATNDLNTVLPDVENASLTLIEQYGPSGLCQIKTSGVIRTRDVNTEVKFRYEDTQGHKSDVKTVSTDHSKTVFFSHQYDVPNNLNGDETGMVRMVGVGDPFETAWESYSMKCVEPGATGLIAELPPTVKMQWVVVEKRAFPINDNEPGSQTQVCPVRLKLVGLIEGRGQMSGYAAFVGDYYFSAPQAYEIENGEKILIGAEREIDWTAALAFSNGVAKRTMTLGFNLTGSNPQSIVASVPKKTEWLTCTQVAVVPGLQGGEGLTVGTRPVLPQAGAGKLKAPAKAPLQSTPQVLQVTPQVEKHQLQPN